MNTAKLNPAFLSYVDKRHDWSNIITAWYLNGASMQKFCVQHQLSVKQFRRWFYKLRLLRPVQLGAAKGATRASDKNTHANRPFLPVTITGLKETLGSSSPCGIELVLAQGHRIHLHEGFDEPMFCYLMSLLGGERC